MKSLSHVRLFETPTRLLCPWDFPGKSTGVGCHSLLQGIFPTQGLNPRLLHCRQMLLPSEPPGKSNKQTNKINNLWLLKEHMLERNFFSNCGKHYTQSRHFWCQLVVLGSKCGQQNLISGCESLFIYLFNLFLAARVSHGSGLSLQTTGSRYKGFSSCGTWATESELSSCDPRAYWPIRDMWDPPGPGIEPMSAALVGGFLTAGLPGESLEWLVFMD